MPRKTIFSSLLDNLDLPDSSEKGVIRIKITTQDHNSNNLFELSGSLYFEITHKNFSVIKAYYYHSNKCHHSNVWFLTHSE